MIKAASYLPLRSRYWSGSWAWSRSGCRYRSRFWSRSWAWAWSRSGSRDD
jgi:hypothetical protein